MEAFFFILLIFTPAALLGPSLGVAPAAEFFLCAIAVIPLAKYIGESVEEISTRTSPALGGLLSSTFGNAPELIIGFFALQAGLFEIVKASITGAIISNLLLVLGLSMLAGGWGAVKQSFNRTAVLASGSTLFIAAIALVMPAIFAQTAGAPAESLSVFVAIALLCVYAATLIFSLRTHKHLYVEEAGHYEPRWSLLRATVTLLAATLAVAWISELLVDSIEPLAAAAGWSQLFIGVVIVAIVGNAAENFSAVNVARKGRMDLSLQIAIGSATQIAMVVAPVLVLASVILATPMNLVFNVFELVSIVLSVVTVNLIIQDGESNWLEGVQLLAAYAIIAVAFFFHP